MKTKIIISALSIALLSACTSTTSTEGSIQGSVTAVNLEQMMVDGPAVITIELADASTQEIRVPSMGINLCASKDIADVYQIKVGDKVEVKGSEGEEGSIIPCESADHFLRVINQ